MAQCLPYLKYHCVKYATIRFPLTSIFPYEGRILNSVLLPEITCQRKPVHRYVLRSDNWVGTLNKILGLFRTFWDNLGSFFMINRVNMSKFFSKF